MTDLRDIAARQAKLTMRHFAESPTMVIATDCKAKVLEQHRDAVVRVGNNYEHPDVPARLTPTWIRSVCKKYGVDRFTVVTVRHLSWHRPRMMGTHYGTWRREQVVGVGPAGAGVISTRVYNPYTARG